MVERRAFVPTPVLLDVTRLVATCWTGRRPTGIDRVARAYLDHYRDRALAVVQHRGVVRILREGHSRALFDLLSDGDADGPARFRARLVGLALRALPLSRARLPVGRSGRGESNAQPIYLNVGHTDFDLDAHHRWTRRAGVDPVYFIHDLIPINHPELCTRHARRRHLGRVVGALRHAHSIVVPSQSVADELADFARARALALPRVIVSRLAPARGAPMGGVFDGRGELARAPRRSASASNAAHPRAYFVCVGTLEPRKNHRLLFDIWRALIEELGEKAPDLVLIGQHARESQRVLAQLLASPELRRHIRLEARCSDAERERLIVGARAVLLPTRAEGFGLPLVEALEMKVPVIASDLQVFREIGEGIPRLIDPTDRAAWTRAILDYCADCPDRERQLARLVHYRGATWHGHFLKVDERLCAFPSAANHDDRRRAG